MTGAMKAAATWLQYNPFFGGLPVFIGLMVLICGVALIVDFLFPGLPSLQVTGFNRSC